MDDDVVTIEELSFDEAEALGFDGTLRSGPTWEVGGPVLRITLADARSFVGIEEVPRGS